MIDIKKSEEEKLYERIPVDLWYKYKFHVKNNKPNQFNSVSMPIVKRNFV